MVEKAMPIYHDATETLDAPMASLSPEAKGRVAAGKIAAREVIDILRPVLFPEDEDG